MTNPHDHIVHDVISIEQEARRLRAEFFARSLRSAFGWLTGLLPATGTTVRS